MPEQNLIRHFLAARMIGGLRAGHDQFRFDLTEMQTKLGIRDTAEVLIVLGPGWEAHRGTRENEIIFERRISAKEALARLED